MSHHSWHDSNDQSIRNHLIYKRYVRRKTSELAASNTSSSSSGLLIAVILLSVFIGIPLILFLTGKLNLFNTCACSETNEPTIERSDKRRKRKSKEKKSKKTKSKNRKRVSFSEDDDQSELTDSQDYSKRKSKKSNKRKVRISDQIEKLPKKEKKKQRHSKRSELDMSGESSNAKSQNPDLSVPLCNQTSSAMPVSSEYLDSKYNVTNPKSIASNQSRTNSTSSEYAYIVYRPDTNYVAVSRSLNNLIPPNTSVIYKVDESSNVDDCEIIKSLENNLIVSNVSSELSPRTSSPVSSLRSNYFIVNSDYLLKQCKNESDSNRNVPFRKADRPNVKQPKEKNAYFLYSTKASQLNLNQSKNNQTTNLVTDTGHNNNRVSINQSVIPRPSVDAPINNNSYLKPALSKKPKKSPKSSYEDESDSDNSEDLEDNYTDKSSERRHSKASNKTKKNKHEKPRSTKAKKHKSSKTDRYKKPSSSKAKRSAKSNKKKPRSESPRKKAKLSSKKKKKKRRSLEMSDDDY